MRPRGVVLSGIGRSPVGRRLGRSALDLTAESALSALADAGLTVADIDGLSTYPGGTDWPPGYSEVGAHEVMTALGLELRWYNGAAETPAQMGSVITAVAVVMAGLARHVLCFRTVTESSRRTATAVKPPRAVGGTKQWTQVYGRSAVNWVGALAQRHMHQFGITKEQLAQIALTDRRHAALNPGAVYGDPLTLDDYLDSKMISTPLCLYDCDVPVDGSIAVIVSAAETTADLACPPVHIESIGSAIRQPFSYDQFDSIDATPAADAASMMWESTDLATTDVDVACIYDGISWLALSWIESLGFCGAGESGSFVEGGTRLALDGELPFNPDGGQLSAGRTHGYGFIHEACVQLRGEGGDRQVAGDPAIVVVTNGAGPYASCMLLRRDA